ncbi:hypothetical protein [Actinomadura sp. 3N407]|uniref:hypothetical protein n=1 Tax=Actinomadura sp. 3N407 TaxID=3457423 RepID=UPI003FCE1B39
MVMIAVVSPGNAPGATTIAFALTLAWPRPALLAECNPTGGYLLAGYFQGQIPADRGLWQLALQSRRGTETAITDLLNQTVPLDEAGSRLLLPGIRDPFRGDHISPEMWEGVATALGQIPNDVVADIGHVGVDLPFPIVQQADLVLMVMRPSLAQAAAARPRLERLRDALGDGAPLGLCLVGEGAFHLREVERSLGVHFVFTDQVPLDTKTAAVLTQGEPARRGFTTAPLMRQSAIMAKGLQRSIAQISADPGTSSPHGAGLAPGAVVRHQPVSGTHVKGRV